MACLAVGSIILTIPGVAPRRRAVRPPGVVDEDEFLSLCIRCMRCIDSCPSGGLRPMSLSDGLANVGSPELSGYCIIFLELLNPSPEKNAGWKESGGEGNPCNKCIMSCPTGALKPVNISGLKMGVAEIDRSRCLSWRGESCTRCFDICPLNAVRVDRRGRPKIIWEKCIGCGQCRYICPVDPPAIQINPVGVSKP